jgi:hypothetical protein
MCKTPSLEPLTRAPSHPATQMTFPRWDQCASLETVAVLLALAPGASVQAICIT